MPYAVLQIPQMIWFLVLGFFHGFFGNGGGDGGGVWWMKQLRVDARPTQYTVESQAACFLENLWSGAHTHSFGREPEAAAAERIVQSAAGVGGKRAAEGREGEDDARARVRRRASGGDGDEESRTPTRSRGRHDTLFSAPRCGDRLLSAGSPALADAWYGTRGVAPGPTPTPLTRPQWVIPVGGGVGVCVT